jgi:hypothetical protein
MAGTMSLAQRPTAIHQSLEEAVASFQTVLSDRQRQELQKMDSQQDVPNVTDVLVFTAGLDSINRQRRGRSTSTRLHLFLSLMGNFCNIMTDGKSGNIADTYVSSHPEIAALVWGSVKLTMSVSQRAWSK